MISLSRKIFMRLLALLTRRLPKTDFCVYSSHFLLMALGRFIYAMEHCLKLL